MSRNEDTQKQSKKSNIQDQLMDDIKSMEAKQQNMNQNHNSRKEGLGPNTKR